ncbi:MAG: hypothetical protein AB7O38_30200, partial [Pirellulaceae bacterium]
EVSSRVDGWPAAFWQRVGAGEVLFFTLGARGWLPAPIPPSEASRPEYVDDSFRHSRVLVEVAGHFFQERPAEIVSDESIQPLLREQIGYRIPSRSLATALLGLNFVALAVAGWWCGRRQHLDRLVWLLPTIAGLTTVAFVTIGLANNRSVPPTVAYTQFVRVFPDTGSATVHGLAGFYQQSTTPLEMSGAPDGMVRPLSGTTEGAVTRLIWGDDERGNWRNWSLAGGSVQMAEFQRLLPVGPRFTATASFGPQGLSGRVVTEANGPLTDVLVAAPPALPLSVRVANDGTLTAGRDAVLPRGQFLDDRMVTDEGRRHQQFYRTLLSGPGGAAGPAPPTLYGWSPAMDIGFDWPDGMRQEGSALVAIPLQLQRTAPGQVFEVPATFIRTEIASGAAGQSMAFNARTGEWIQDASIATQSRLRFQLPSQVVPCQVQEARLTIKLNAPSRKLQVSAVIDEADHLVREVTNPNGVYHLTVTEPDQLRLDNRGGLQFTIAVTESVQERESREAYAANVKSRLENDKAPLEGLGKVAESFSTWQIEYVLLDVRGVTE